MSCSNEVRKLRDALDALRNSPEWPAYVKQLEEIEAWREHQTGCARMGLGACLGIRSRIKRELEELEDLEKELQEEMKEVGDALGKAGACVARHYIAPFL